MKWQFFDFVWFGFVVFYVPVESHDHVETICSTNHTFFLGKLDKVFNQYFEHIL